MLSSKADDNIVYLNARLQDVECLTTIVPRAFFAVNAMMKKFLPDTPTMRAWWARVFEGIISDPNSYVPIAIDPSTNTVVGAMMLHGVRKGQPFGGFMRDHPPTEDHDGENWLKAMKEFAEREESTVGDRDRFLIEVMGIDSGYQGKGVGKQLVKNACEIADANGWPIFLETSAAREYYLNQGLGFKVVAEEDDGEKKGGVILREPVEQSQ